MSHEKKRMLAIEAVLVICAAVFGLAWTTLLGGA